jgi:histone H3/H4
MARRKQISNKAQGNVAAPQEGDQKNDNSKRKYKPATNMLRAIRKEQASTKLLLKKKPFFERARAVATAINRGQPLQWTSKALDQLIDTAQQQLLERFQDSNDMRIHRGKKTLVAKDMRVARKTTRLPIDAPISFVLPKPLA